MASYISEEKIKRRKSALYSQENVFTLTFFAEAGVSKFVHVRHSSAIKFIKD